MKGGKEDGPQDESTLPFECNESDLQESASCSFVEHPKDNTKNIPEDESSGEDSDSVHVDKMKKTKRETTEDESIVSRGIAEPTKVQTRIIYLPATQSFRNEPVPSEKEISSTQKTVKAGISQKGSEVPNVKRLCRSDEITSDDEKDSCSDESSESHEDIPYTKLPHSIPSDALSNKSLSTDSNDKEIDKETPILTDKPIVASAAFTATFSTASPVSREKHNLVDLKSVDNKETKMQLPKQSKQTHLHEIPHENAAIVSLHGSSVEEECFSNEERNDSLQGRKSLEKEELQPSVNYEPNRTFLAMQSQENPILQPVIDEGDGLMQSIPSTSSGVDCPSTLKEGTENTRKKPIFLKLPHESEVIVSAKSSESEESKTGDSLTPELSNLQTIQRIYREKRRKKPRIFKKVPNENAVFVPLHSSSDEDEKTLEEDIRDAYEGLETSEAEATTAGEEDFSAKSGEYLIYVPLVDEPNEVNKKKQKKQIRNDEQFADSHPSIAAAAFTSLFSAFSPLGGHETSTAVNNELGIEENQQEKIEEPVKPKKHKRTIFKKVPNENAVFVPLHSSSEEDNPSESGQRGDVDCFANEQQTAEYIEKSEIEINNDIGKKHQDKNSDNQLQSVTQPQEASGITQPSVATAAFTALFSAFSPLGTHEGFDNDSQNNDSDRNESLQDQALKKKKIFKKLPNENAYFIPLHSSSEEDNQGGESTENIEAPASDGFSGPVSENKEKDNHSQEDENIISHDASTKTFQETPPVTSKENEIVIGTPTIEAAAFSSLFSAFSPLAMSESGEQENLPQKNTDEQENNVKKKKFRPRIFKKVPNEDAVYIPLHSSEEDILNINVGTPNSEEGVNDEGKAEMDIEEPNKYSVYVPLKDESKYVSKHKAQLLTSGREEDIVIDTPTIATAAFSSLFSAFSPLGSSESARAHQEYIEEIYDRAENSSIQTEASEENETKVRKKKTKIYKKVPNQDAVYIPLHSSEEDVLEGDEHSTESQEQKPPGENFGKTDFEVPKGSAREALNEERQSADKKVDTTAEECISQSPRREKEITVSTPTVATAAFSSLFSAFSPLGSSESANAHQEKTEVSNIETVPHDEISEKKHETSRKKKRKIFKKVPNEDAVYIPLHSSEEDILQSEESLDKPPQEQDVTDPDEHHRYAIFVSLTEEEKKVAQGVDTTEEEAHRIEEVALKSPALASAAFNSFFHAVSPLGSSQDPSNEEQSSKYILRTYNTEEEEYKSIISDKVINKDTISITSEDDLQIKERISVEESPEFQEEFAKKSDENRSDLNKSVTKLKREKIDTKKDNVILSQPSVATAAFTALYSASISPASNSAPEQNPELSVGKHVAPNLTNEDSVKINNEAILASSEDGAVQAEIIPVEDSKNVEENSTGDKRVLESYENSLSNISQTTVATAAFTSLFTVLSPLGEKAPVNEKEEGVEMNKPENEIPTKKPIRRKQRIFKKVPNENAVYVPLHSSSEEDQSCEQEEINSGEMEGDMNNLHEYDKPNEYKIFVPLNEDEPKRSKEKRRNQTLNEISQPSVAAAAFTALFSAFSPLGSTEQMKNTDTSELPFESFSNKEEPKKSRAVFKKIPNEDAFIIPLKASLEDEDANIEEGNNKDESMMAEGNENIKTSDPSIEADMERNRTHQLKTEESSKIENIVVNGNKTVYEVMKESKQTDNAISESETDQSSLNKLSKKDDVPKVKKGVVKSILKKSKPDKEISPSKENNTNKTQKCFETQEKTVQIDEPIILDISSINTEELKNQAQKEDGNKYVTEESLRKEPKKVKATELEVQTKPKKSFKLADIVLDVLTKKEKDKTTGAAQNGKPLEEISAGQQIEGTTSCDHEYEPIQAPRAASQPDVRSPPLEILLRREQGEQLMRKEQVQLNDSKEEPLSLKEQARQKEKEEEDRYEVVRPPEGPAVQEATLSLQADGGYEVIDQPRKEQRRCIKIPDEDAIIVPLHGSSDEEINPDRYQNPALMMSEEEIESFPKQPLPYVNIPSRNKPQKDNQEGTFQDKLKNQADRFTTKLRGISKPKIVIHKPKIKLPERPKMPEIPKIKLPERPKFNLPNRPKFNLPERPKFHLPDKSKFHLPEKPKFLTERPKFLSERPKFLSERPSFKLPERFTRHEKKPKAPKGKKPNPSSQRRPLRDVVTISSQSTPGSTQNIFETLKFKTYPRFFKKKKAPPIQKMSSLDTESSQPSTPPRRPRRFSDQPQDVGWVHAYDRDIKFADEETQLRIERMEEEYVREDCAPFQDNFEDDITNLEEEELRKGKAESLTSVVSEKGSSGSSSNRRRAGVIEEIDSDEFFVRQKGLSREDVDVSRYLSLEIRDAFRQPKNALASLDNEMYDEEKAPRAPERRRSRKSDHFHTFPKRPSRRKESDPEPRIKPPRRFRSKSGGRSRQSSMPSLSLEPLPQPPSRKSRERSLRSLNREGRASDLDIVQPRISAQNSGDIPPVPPLRKSRSRGTSLADDDRTSRGADSLLLPDDELEVPQPPLAEREFDEEIMMDEEIEEDVEEEVPVKQIKNEPSRTSELIEIDDRYNTDNFGYAVVSKERKKPPRPPPPPSQHFDFHSQLDSIKATGKNIFFTYPRRAMKSLHKPFPQRPLRNYNTLGPVRPPRRNRVFRKPVYMTGEVPTPQETFFEKERDLQSGEVVSRMKGRPLPPPPRPPRKSREYDELIGEINETSPTETLVATTEVEMIKEKEPVIQEGKKSYFQTKKDELLQTMSRYSPFESKKEEDSREQTTTGQQTSFDYGEVSVSIQTDPLPKDVIVIDQEIEETEEILILSDSNGKEFRDEKTEVENVKEKRISEEVKESKSAEDIQLQEPQESIESNIFQQALERVEAARGVLKEARERVIPGSTNSLEERRTTDESESQISRINLRESLPTSSRSEGTEKEETPPPLPSRPLYTKPIPVSFPDKLHLSELDVDKLNVSEIQANKIKVSEIESTCIDVTDLTSRGGNLTLNGLELPPDFISNVVAQVTSQVTTQVASQVSSQVASQVTSQVASQVTSQVQNQLSQQIQCLQAQRELTPQRQVRRVLTPPPSIVVQASAEPISAPEPIAPQTEIREHIPQPKTTRSKGRKSPTRVIDDSEDELASIMPQRRNQEKEKRIVEKKVEVKKEEKNGESKKEEKKSLEEQSGEVKKKEIVKAEDPEVPSPSMAPSLEQASSLQLLGRLLSIWQRQIFEGAGSFVEGVNALFPDGEKRRDAQVAAVILLILITGLVLIGFGFDHSVHHHHWDYLPPR